MARARDANALDSLEKARGSRCVAHGVAINEQKNRYVNTNGSKSCTRQEEYETFESRERIGR